MINDVLSESLQAMASYSTGALHKSTDSAILITGLRFSHKSNLDIVVDPGIVELLDVTHQVTRCLPGAWVALAASSAVDTTLGRLAVEAEDAARIIVMTLSGNCMWKIGRSNFEGTGSW
jgi:hypothetical protein